MIDSGGLLMIEPIGKGSDAPVVDDLTRKMTAAWRRAFADPNRRYRGVHRCACGATSGNQDYYVDVGGVRVKTNSLAVHYMALHRGEVPQAELDKVASLAYGLAEPYPTEFRYPGGTHL